MRKLCMLSAGLLSVTALIMLSVVDTAAGESPRRGNQASVLRTLGDWRFAWQRTNLPGYMSHYAKDARIVLDTEDHHAFDYGSYYRFEQAQFAHDRGSPIHQMTIDHLAMQVRASIAILRFHTRLNLGGGTTFGDEWGTRTLSLRRTPSGTWLIVRDVSKFEGDM